MWKYCSTHNFNIVSSGLVTIFASLQVFDWDKALPSVDSSRILLCLGMGKLIISSVQGIISSLKPNDE